jgi:mannose-6-phosphate isomerase
VIVFGKLIPLNDLIRKDPAGMMGEWVARRFKGKLPFLIKVLAAERPLSIQAHPDLDQARNGFQREEAAGIPRTADLRNYRDPNHKPELICALTTFDALQGFRPLAEIMGLLDYLDLTRFMVQPETNAKARNPSLYSLFHTLFHLSRKKRDILLKELVQRTGTISPRSEVEKSAFFWITKLSRYYPGDIGIIAPLLLNAVRLQPGEALYTEAGVLHAYLAGAGVEVMASSDNVLRGGLTTKHVDPAELLKNLNFASQPVRIFREENPGAVEFIYQSPAAEFQLSRIILKQNGSYSPGRRTGPEIILCTEGSAEVLAKPASSLKLTCGDSIFIPFAVGDYLFRGEATFYRATVSCG